MEISGEISTSEKRTALAHSDSQNQLPKVEATLYQCSVEGKGKLPQYLPKNKLMSMSQIWFRSFLTRHDHLLNKMEPYVQKHYNHIWHNMNSIRKSMTDITTSVQQVFLNVACPTMLCVPQFCVSQNHSQPVTDLLGKRYVLQFAIAFWTTIQW